MWGGVLGAVLLLLFACAICTTLIVLFRPTPVTLVVAGEAFPMQTRAETVATLLQERGIALGEGDRVSPALDAALTPDMVVQIERARVVTLLVDGEMRVLNTPLTDPVAILAEEGVEFSPLDRIILDGSVVTADEIGNWPVPVSSITLRRSVTFDLNDDSTSRSLETTAATVGEALFEAGVTIFMSDTVSPALDAPLSDGLTVNIVRARPVTIIADGARVQTRLQGSTVGEALAEAGVALVGADYAVPGEDQPLVGGMAIRVIRVQETELVEETELPYETVYQADAALELDQQRTAQAGQPGLERRIIRVRSENGIEVSREVTETLIVREVVNEVISYGTNVVVRSLDTPQGPRQYWRVLRMYATSYHPAALGGDDVTATGRRLTTGIVASSPRVIPYGTEVYVEGYGVGLMADTGGPRRFPLWIDLGYSDADFRSWSRYVNVYILTPVPPTIDYIVP
jgi:uncharacterized protein YabE (DUF348 family)/3D (Asp-Asp-Asp) domain-containing protein